MKCHQATRYLHIFSVVPEVTLEAMSVVVPLVSSLYQDKGDGRSNGRKQCPSQGKATRNKNTSMTIGPGNSSSLFRLTLLPLAPSQERSAAGTQKTELRCTDYPSHLPSSKLSSPGRDSSWLKG